MKLLLRDEKAKARRVAGETGAPVIFEAKKAPAATEGDDEEKHTEPKSTEPKPKAGTVMCRC